MILLRDSSLKLVEIRPINPVSECNEVLGTEVRTRNRV
jgi:hypothetical protein